nr:gastrokine-1-like [Meriones unguiculatus]
MKLTMIFVGLLGLLRAPGFAYNINVNDSGNVDGSGQQSVSINNQHNVANVDNNDGWNSWNALWDYENDKGPGGAPHKDLMYSINPARVEDLSTFGPKIAGMCHGIPTYVAEEIPGPNQPFYSQKCYTANILWILRLSFCGTSTETY